MIYWIKCFINIVGRYLGEDEEESLTKESHSQALLLKLQQKAKERQRKSLTEHRQDSHEEHTKKKALKTKNKSGNQRLHKGKKRNLEYDLEEPIEVKKKKEEENGHGAEVTVNGNVFPGV